MTGSENFPPPQLAQLGEIVESSLREFMDERTLPLYTMMGYQFGWVDEHGDEVARRLPERIRGAICLLASGSDGGFSDRAARAAGAIELLHNFSLIHADIQEGSTDRDDRPAVWWTWGAAQAINAGDGMHALARLALFSLSEMGAPAHVVGSLLKTLDEAALTMCEGTYQDTVFQQDMRVSVDDYLSMAQSQVGAPIAAAGQLGVLLSGTRDDDVAEAIGRYGRSLGTALRLAADYAAFWPASERDETTQGKLIAKKKTYPVIHAMNASDAPLRRELGNAYTQRVLDPASIERLVDVLESSGGKAATMDRMDDAMGDATAAAGEFSGNDGQIEADLIELARYAVQAQLAGELRN
jgi:geranylgeranyl diphosphate synthase type I